MRPCVQAEDKRRHREVVYSIRRRTAVFRGRIAVKDKTIEALLERDQKMLGTLLGQPAELSDRRDDK